MTTKIKTESKTRTIKAYDLAGIESAYQTLIHQEKELMEHKAYLQDIARKEAGKSPDGVWGAFRLIQKSSLSWDLPDIQKLYPSLWTAYVTPDNKVLREKKDDALIAVAKVKFTEALLFNSKN